MRQKLLALAAAAALLLPLACPSPARAETPPDYVAAFGADQCAKLQIVIVAGDVTTVYLALAPAGTAATAAAWQCSKTVITVSGGTTTVVVTWADGNLRFDNTPGANGSGLAALTYQ